MEKYFKYKQKYLLGKEHGGSVTSTPLGVSQAPRLPPSQYI